jgi:hypothetical protein
MGIRFRPGDGLRARIEWTLLRGKAGEPHPKRAKYGKKQPKNAQKRPF